MIVTEEADTVCKLHTRLHHRASKVPAVPAVSAVHAALTTSTHDEFSRCKPIAHARRSTRRHWHVGCLRDGARDVYYRVIRSIEQVCGMWQVGTVSLIEIYYVGQATTPIYVMPDWPGMPRCCLHRPSSSHGVLPRRTCRHPSQQLCKALRASRGMQPFSTARLPATVTRARLGLDRSAMIEECTDARMTACGPGFKRWDIPLRGTQDLELCCREPVDN